MQADTWTDMYSLFPTSVTFGPWNSRTVPCPGGGALTVTIVDIPSLGALPAARFLAKLYQNPQSFG